MERTKILKNVQLSPTIYDLLRLSGGGYSDITRANLSQNHTHVVVGDHVCCFD